MSDTTPALDEAFERMAAASFELPNGFVNHGAMACEALAMLDCTDDIDGWARRFAQAGGASVEAVAPAGFEWRQALGAYDRLPEWIGYFTRAIDDDGWASVVETWVPRLMPALRTALFHGAIRTAHAVRAIDAVDSSPRRGELARALGYWAARYRAGQPRPRSRSAGLTSWNAPTWRRPSRWRPSTRSPGTARSTCGRSGSRSNSRSILRSPRAGVHHSTTSIVAASLRWVCTTSAMSA
jgi:hypothetical protein